MRERVARNLKKSYPYFDSCDLKQQLENSPFYTDTDSIQIHAKNMKDLVMDNEIGGISDDLGENSKILYEGWIAPKLYFLKYVEKLLDHEEIKISFAWPRHPQRSAD